MTTPILRPPRAVISYRVGGHEVPLKTDRQCRVCTSPFRMEIEKALMKGATYQQSLDSLDGEHGLHKRNVGDHYRKHMSLEDAKVRHLMETQALAVGKSIEEGNESLVDGIVLAKTVVMKTFEAIADGSLTPDVADGMRAMKLLSDLGEYDQGGGMDMSAMVDAFMVYHEAAERHMAPEQFTAFQRALEESPVLKALESRYAAQQGQTVEGEVEEESDS